MYKEVTWVRVKWGKNFSSLLMRKIVIYLFSDGNDPVERKGTIAGAVSLSWQGKVGSSIQRRGLALALSVVVGVF